MPRPSGQVTDIQPLTKMEYFMILSHLVEHWRLFYEMLWETGIRIGEGLAVERKDLENCGVWITREKRTDHPREHLPLSAGLFARIIAHSYAHKDVKVWPFSSSGAWLALKKAAAAAGVRKTMHPHLFRHAMGYRARQAGNDIAVVAGLLGHKKIESAETYFKATEAELKDTMRKLNE